MSVAGIGEKRTCVAGCFRCEMWPLVDIAHPTTATVHFTCVCCPRA